MVNEIEIYSVPSKLEEYLQRIPGLAFTSID